MTCKKREIDGDDNRERKQPTKEICDEAKAELTKAE
jgi:hypothetical protein